MLLEALACGTPVVAFRQGCVTEVVNHGRTGFVWRDVQEMAAAIGMVDEPDRGACRAAVERHFSARRMVADHLNVYRRIVDRHRRMSAQEDRAAKTRTGVSAPSTA